jgi:transposase
MMGKQAPQEAKLFYYDICLERRIPKNHLLRKIKNILDFDFVYPLVKDCYGNNGNVSVPPPVIMKMMLLLFLYDVRSERELMDTIPFRMDWLWFLGYDLDEGIPNHSVLSKARARWGADVFESLFVQTVAQCVKAGLVNGRKIHVDGSLIDANASNNAVIRGPEELIAQLRDTLDGELSKLDQPVNETTEVKKRYPRKNKKLLNTTDPDAAMVRKGSLSSRARFKAHRVVDDQCGVITATETTSGDVEENMPLMDLIDQHEENTRQKLETVVGDKQYGTADNFRKCHERGIRSHMGDLIEAQEQRAASREIFGREAFIYDPETDTYTCPAGEIMTRRKHKKQRKAYEYACSMATCKACHLRAQCTRAKGGVARTLKRHYNQEAIDQARAQSYSRAAVRDRIRRRWLMEGSFADATVHHGFKRSRWRRLWRQRIQDLLIAAVQNLRLLARKVVSPKAAMACSAAICGVSYHEYAYVAVCKRPLGPVMHFEANMIDVSSK